MDDRLDAILQSCLDRIEHGDSLEACLRDYPALRNDLGGLLRTVVAIRSLPPLPPPNLAAIEQIVQARAAALRAPVAPQDLPPGGSSGSGASSIPGWFLPTLLIVATTGVLLLGALLTGILVSRSAQTPTAPAHPISARTATMEANPKTSVTPPSTATSQPVWPTSILLPVPSPTTILLPVPSLTPIPPPPRPPAVAPRPAPPPAVGNSGGSGGGDDDDDDDDDDD